MMQASRRFERQVQALQSASSSEQAPALALTSPSPSTFEEPIELKEPPHIAATEVDRPIHELPVETDTKRAVIMVTMKAIYRPRRRYCRDLLGGNLEDFRQRRGGIRHFLER